MGNTGSRRKKVAPALVKEVNICDRDCCHIDRNESCLFTSQTSNVNVTRKRTQLDRHSDRQDLDFSADENLAEEVDRILETCEGTAARPNNGSSQNSLFRSKIYGLYFAKCDQSHSKTTRNANLSQNSGLHNDHLKVDGLKVKKEVCAQNKPGPVDSHKKSIVAVGRAGPVCTKTVLVPEICNHPSQVLPVTYDSSEEDLMNMIEREFG
ncbi:hypothetical protein P4O66_011854 [Electrophorus voltai]|uniref:Uncharacterized protein n=1 Tax=Electrophorus voltai TaxID=2609070 RepID=A0AAD8Z8F0_9TELE|nr:hypothetical protein P4O66_011854 [Electrophorus voltai]